MGPPRELAAVTCWSQSMATVRIAIYPDARDPRDMEWVTRLVQDGCGDVVAFDERAEGMIWIAWRSLQHLRGVGPGHQDRWDPHRVAQFRHARSGFGTRDDGTDMRGALI